MTIYILPDVESIVVSYLKASVDVTNLIPASRIAAELPPKAEFPFLVVSLIAGNVPVERRLTAPSVQVDAWGGSRLEARTLAATSHAALVEMVGPQGNFGIVSGVETILGVRKLFDRDSNRARYLFEVRVWAHPLHDVGS